MGVFFRSKHGHPQLIMKKGLVYSAAFLFFIALCKKGVLIPKNTSNATCLTAYVEEVEADVAQGGIVLKLRNDPAFYTLNSGLESILEIKILKAKLEQQEVRISYIEDMSTKDPSKQIRHISSISKKGEHIYKQYTP